MVTLNLIHIQAEKQKRKLDVKDMKPVVLWSVLKLVYWKHLVTDQV